MIYFCEDSLQICASLLEFGLRVVLFFFAPIHPKLSKNKKSNSLRSSGDRSSVDENLEILRNVQYCTCSRKIVRAWLVVDWSCDRQPITTITSFFYQCCSFALLTLPSRTTHYLEVANNFCCESVIIFQLQGSAVGDVHSPRCNIVQ